MSLKDIFSKKESTPKPPKMQPTKETIKEAAINCLRNVYDPEIPVNIYDLGLIYDIDVTDEFYLIITMTLTAPDCPEAEAMVNQAYEMCKYIEGVKTVNINLTFDPPWDFSRMPDEAKIELGLM